MSSPFSPEQKNLILAGAGFFVLLSCWQAMKALWNHYLTGNRLRFTPLAIALLGLVVAVEVVMVVNLSPFFLRHPLRMPTLPMIGSVLIIIASVYDQRHAPPEEKRPSRTDLFRSRMQASLGTCQGLPPDRPLLAHLKSLLRFYLGTQEVHIVSRYGLVQALSRIRDLKKTGEIHISEKRPDKLIVCATRVRGNELPVFRGTLNERDGRAVLDGRIEIDFGIVTFLGLFGLLLLMMLLASLFTEKTWSERFMGFLVPLMFFVLLEFAYIMSKRSPELIVSNLERALRG